MISVADREKLEQVIRVLNNVEKKQYGFDLEVWYCGYTACTIGWCAQDNWFVGRGLKLCSTSGVDGYPIFKEYDSWSAVYNFFASIDRRDLDWLFSDNSYPEMHASAYHVANRIAEFLQGA